MKHQLENNFLSIAVNDDGGELVSIFDKEKDREILWQADPAYWKRHAPILFPTVGKSHGNYILHKSVKYPASQHGFARDSRFTVVRETETSITHQLVSSPETLKIYPFDFVLEITHTLEGRNVKVGWFVENRGEDIMYFTIGGHPAFRVPILPGTKQTDYQLLFHRDTLQYKLLDTATGTLETEPVYDLPLKDQRCPVAENMFAKDALVFDYQIEWAGIGLPDGSPYLSLSCPGFPNFGIWAAPNAPFICLEPWDGRCDNKGFQGELKDKPGIIALTSSETYHKEYTITVY